MNTATAQLHAQKSTTIQKNWESREFVEVSGFLILSISDLIYYLCLLCCR